MAQRAFQERAGTPPPESKRAAPAGETPADGDDAPPRAEPGRGPGSGAYEAFFARVVEGREFAEAAYRHLERVAGKASAMTEQPGLYPEPHYTAVLRFPELWRQLGESSGVIEIRPHHGEVHKNVDLTIETLEEGGLRYRFRHEGIQIRLTLERSAIPPSLVGPLSEARGGIWTSGEPTSR